MGFYPSIMSFRAEVVFSGDHTPNLTYVPELSSYFYEYATLSQAHDTRYLGTNPVPTHLLK